MKLTKLRAAPVRRAEVPPCARSIQLGAGTASQLIPGVRRTWRARVSVAVAGVVQTGEAALQGMRGGLGRLRGWSLLGLVLCVPFTALLTWAYGSAVGCAMNFWLGSCADREGPGLLLFFLGLPLSGLSVCAGSTTVGGGIVLLAPVLNAILIYNLGQAIQYSWPGSRV